MRHIHSSYKTNSTTKTSRIWPVVLLISFFAGTALESRVSAGVILTIQQSGDNVLASADGTIDTAALTHVIFGSMTAEVYPSSGFALVGTSAIQDEMSGILGPSAIGPGPPATATTAAGDSIGVFGAAQSILVPLDYISGNPLSGTATWAGQTIASLGLTPGTYTWTWGTGPTADSFTVNVGGQAVPEPTSICLALIGSVGIFAARWQFGRRKTQKRQGPEGSHGAAE